jgi:hypothetical protein
VTPFDIRQSAHRPSALLFFALKTQLTAGLHERFYRFVYTYGVLVIFDGNDDAALIAPNGKNLQSRVLPLSGSFQKVLCVILLVICVKPRCLMACTASA